MNENKVLHICSYFIGNKLYKFLFEELEKKHSQTVYIPIKDEKLMGKNSFSSKKTSFFYDSFLQPYHRYLYGLKIRSQLKRLEKKLGKQELLKLQCIHAHTLFSDGGTAYLLHRKYQIPYVVSLRNTDLNVFYKYALHYRWLAHRVLKNASKIIFISHAYKKHFINILPKKIVQENQHKFEVIPNGITETFLEPLGEKHKFIKHNMLELITVGSLDKNKNINTLISCIPILKKEFHVLLKVVGQGNMRRELEEQAKALGVEQNVQFLGQVNAEELKILLDDSDVFILTSIKETFGISYIEALARSVPIIYTKDQGVDGYFPAGKVGFAVNPTNEKEIILAVHKVLNNYTQISLDARIEGEKFSWRKIAEKYFDIYK